MREVGLRVGRCGIVLLHQSPVVEPDGESECFGISIVLGIHLGGSLEKLDIIRRDKQGHTAMTWSALCFFRATIDVVGGIG